MRGKGFLDTVGPVLYAHGELTDPVGARGPPAPPPQVPRRQGHRARKLWFNPRTASELEFYLFKDTFEAAAGKGYQNLEPYGRYIEDYHILPGTKAEWFNRPTRHGQQGAGVQAGVRGGGGGVWAWRA